MSILNKEIIIIIITIIIITACLKKTGVKLDLLTDNDILLMFEKEIRGGMRQATYRYAKANNKYMTDNDKNKESSYV